MTFATMPPLALSGARFARLALVIIGFVVALAAAPASAQTLTPEQRTAVTDLIRETLMKNPEIIQEAMVELERRNTAAQAEGQRTAVATEKARLIDPATSAIVGNPQGDVTMIEFIDYNCGFCKKAVEDVKALASTTLADF